MQIAARKAGFLTAYSGTDGTAQGWLDDFDGKWVYLTLDNKRTLGSLVSGAQIADGWTLPLFSHFWSQYDNTACPLLDAGGSATARGASAVEDWSAGRRITLPDFRGRVILASGTGGGLTARAKGTQLGTETHTLTAAQIPALSIKSATRTVATLGNASAVELADTSVALGSSSLVNSTGGGQPHPNMQPSAVEHLLISAGAR